MITTHLKDRLIGQKIFSEIINYLLTCILSLSCVWRNSFLVHCFFILSSEIFCTITFQWWLFSTYFGSIQIFCTIRLTGHRIEPGTAMQCKTKDSSWHRQSSVQVWSGIRAAQSSVFCVMFFRTLFIIFFFWPLHCLSVFELWLPITLLASTNFSYLLT
jgi:hypothetical protein